MTDLKQLETTLPPPPMHWVGDGFPVRSAFSPQSVRARLSPFVLLDYGGPAEFGPAEQPRGVGSHPHRGFETVTVVFQGEVEHRDSAGNSGRIGPGDVQWMTAGSGVLHEELHSREFTQRGGTFEMAQLWVNLPARDKRHAPRYQTLTAAAIPSFELPDGAGTLRAIAGEYAGRKGAAETFTPVVVWDVRLVAGGVARLPMPEGFTTAVYVRHGAVSVAGAAPTKAGHLAVLSRSGAEVVLKAPEGAQLLVLGGEPIDEPVVAYGPFVMNTEREIAQAIEDFQKGKFGELEPATRG